MSFVPLCTNSSWAGLQVSPLFLVFDVTLRESNNLMLTSGDNNTCTIFNRNFHIFCFSSVFIISGDFLYNPSVFPFSLAKFESSFSSHLTISISTSSQKPKTKQIWSKGSTCGEHKALFACWCFYLILAMVFSPDQMTKTWCDVNEWWNVQISLYILRHCNNMHYSYTCAWTRL